MIVQNHHHVLGRILSGGGCLGNVREQQVNEESCRVDQHAEIWEVKQSLYNAFLSIREDVENL